MIKTLCGWLAVAGFTASFAAEIRNWKPAAVISMDSGSLILPQGTTTTGQVDSFGNVQLQSTPDYSASTLHTYILETADDLVVVDHWLRRLWSKPCKASVGDQIYWTPTKKGMRIKCTAGDEHDVAIQARVPKSPDMRGGLYMALRQHRATKQSDVVTTLPDCASVLQMGLELDKAQSGGFPAGPQFMKACELSLAMARIAGKGYVVAQREDGGSDLGFVDEITTRPGHFSFVFLPDERIEVIAPASAGLGRLGNAGSLAGKLLQPPVSTAGFGKSFASCADLLEWQRAVLHLSDQSQFAAMCEKAHTNGRNVVRVLFPERAWMEYFADEVPSDSLRRADMILVVAADGRAVTAVRTNIQSK